LNCRLLEAKIIGIEKKKNVDYNHGNTTETGIYVIPAIQTMKWCKYDMSYALSYSGYVLLR